MSYFIRHNMQIMSVLFILMAFVFYRAGLSTFNIDAAFLLEGALFLDDVLIYIAALEILKNALNQRKLLAGLQYRPNGFSYHQTRLLAMVSAFPFGLGVSSFLKGLSKDEIDTKPISEGMTASMLIYPTTLASGFVFDSFGLTSLSALFLFGLPVVLCIILPWPKGSFSALAKSNLFQLTLTLGLINYGYLVVLSQFIDHHYMLKQAAFFILLGFVINYRTFGQIPHVLWRARSSFIFFICVGMLGHAFIGWMAQLPAIPLPTWLNTYIALFVPVFIIPLLSILFIHPLVLFVIFSPLLSPYLQSTGIDEQTLYAVWVVMLINAQLLSPVSLTTVLSVSNSNSNIFSESFLKHSGYSLKVSCLAYAYFILALNWS